MGSKTALLALVGIVPVKVSDEGGGIGLGDLLVPSSIPGLTMRSMDPLADCSHTALVGKALEDMTDRQGMILVLLTAR